MRLPPFVNATGRGSDLLCPACGWPQAKCIYHIKAAMGLLQQHGLCDAQYDFVSQWDYQRGACALLNFLPAALVLPILPCRHSICGCDADALANRRQESAADAPVSFGLMSSQQRVPERNTANQLSSELRAAFPLPAASADSASGTADAGVDTGSSTKRQNANEEAENRTKKIRT